MKINGHLNHYTIQKINIMFYILAVVLNFQNLMHVWHFIRLAIFHMLNSCMWLVASVLGGAGIEKENNPEVINYISLLFLPSY